MINQYCDTPALWLPITKMKEHQDKSTSELIKTRTRKQQQKDTLAPGYTNTKINHQYTPSPGYTKTGIHNHQDKPTKQFTRMDQHKKHQPEDSWSLRYTNTNIHQQQHPSNNRIIQHKAAPPTKWQYKKTCGGSFIE